MKKIDDLSWKTLKTRLAESEEIPSKEMGEAEKEYVHSRGVEILKLHATDFIRKRLAPAAPKNDGRQTPLKGHPVFIAQHATGTSDRKKLEKFHGIKEGAELSEKEIAYVVDIIIRWIEEEAGEPT